MSCSTHLPSEPSVTAVLNVKLSLEVECSPYVTLDLIQRLPALKYRPSKLVKNFLIIKSSDFSYTVFVKKQKPTSSHRSHSKFLHINVSGLKALHFVNDATQWILSRLKPFCIQGSERGIPSSKTTVDAITSKCSLNRQLHLGAVAKNFADSAPQCQLAFNRTSFPALTVRHPELKTAVIFSSGSVVFFGQNNLSQQRELLDLLIQNAD